VSRIENKALYAQITEPGYYVVASYQNVITVDPDKPEVSGSNYRELSAALQYLINKHIADGGAPNRYEVHVAGRGGVPYICDGQFIPANTLIQGGYDFARSNMPDPANNQTVIKPGSTIKAALICGNRNYFFTDAANKYTDFNRTIIDGFVFNGQDNMGSPVTAQAGAVHISGAWHVRDIRFRNCVFTENKGTMAGAVFINNSSLIFFDNCVFTGNVSTAGGEFDNPVCNNNGCRDDLVADNFSGGAVTIFEFDGCGSEVEFHSCVFYNNSTTFTGYTGADSKLGGAVSIYGGAGPGRPVKIVNSTFTKNSVVGSDAGSGRSVYSGPFEAMSGTPVVLMNNILYGNSGPAVEVSGVTEADVTYKTNIRMPYLPEPPEANDYTVAGISYCDIEGFSGTNPSNINSAPLFEADESDKVTGPDGSWLTADDGLNVKMASPVRKMAKADVLPEQLISTETDYYRKEGFFDAANRLRRGFEVSASTYRTDMGAYEKYVKVMCIGDQNTVGHMITLSRKFISYRNHLKAYADGAKIEIEFVGNQQDEHGLHEGFANKKIEYFYETYDVASKVEKKKADVVFIMLGTENIRDIPTVIVEKLYSPSKKSLISEIISKEGVKPIIFVGTIPEIKEKHDLVTAINDEIKKSSPWNTITTHVVKSVVIDPEGKFYDDNATDKWPCNYNDKLLKDSGYSIIAKSFNHALESNY